MVSEREYADENLKELHNLVAALFRLENSRHSKQLLEVVVNLLQWLADPEQASLRRAFTVWFARVLFPTRFSFDWAMSKSQAGTGYPEITRAGTPCI